MSATIRNLTIDGVTKGVSEWAKEAGISPTTLHGRLERGWSPEEALKAPVSHPSVSKSDAEYALNDMTRRQLPAQLAKLLPETYRGVKYGEYLRTNFRKQWDEWFENVYAKNHERKK